MKRILLTGATGYLGGHLGHPLCSKYEIVTLGRQKANHDFSITDFQIPSFENCDDFGDALAGVDVVIHAAALVHQRTQDSVELYNKVNVDFSIALAKEAIKNGCKRFVFISSIAVNTNSSKETITAESHVEPVGLYANSKWQAEVELMKLTESSNIEMVIIRPPMVYGPNCPGNFTLLKKIVSLPVPLPLGSIHNKKSFVSIFNLVDFISVCIEHPAAKNELFLVSDDEDVSTTELIRYIIKCSGKYRVLIPFPMSVFEFAFSLIGKKELVSKLTSSMCIDIEKSKRILSWSPSVSVEDGVKRSVSTSI